MNTSFLNICPEIIISIAKAIGKCDFRTNVSLYTTSDHSPWVITVGESNWQRHLIVTRVMININGLEDATLGILSVDQSNNSGYDIRTDSIESHIKLSDLTAERYIGVKRVLYPPK